MVWLTDESRLALFPAGTIVRDPQHRESPTHHEEDTDIFMGYKGSISSKWGDEKKLPDHRQANVQFKVHK